VKDLKRALANIQPGIIEAFKDSLIYGEGRAMATADGVEHIPHPAKFCWECGRKLRGKFAYQIKADGHWRTVHKSCGERRGTE